MQQNADKLVASLKKVPGLVSVFTMFRSNTPQLYMDIDRTKVRTMGVTIGDLNDTLQIYLGSAYVNNFNAFGRYWQVNIMADGTFRTQIEDINQLKVRNSHNQMVPLNTLVDMRSVNGPVMVTRSISIPRPRSTAASFPPSPAVRRSRPSTRWPGKRFPVR